MGESGIRGEKIGESVESNGLGRRSKEFGNQLVCDLGVPGIGCKLGEKALALFGHCALDW